MIKLCTTTGKLVSLPIDYSPSDLEEWASMQKVDVQIQHIEKYMNGKGEVLYDFPDLELTQEKESLKTTDKSNALYEIVKAGLLNVGEIVHFDYGPKGKPKTHFEGKICSDGIEVDGIVSSASVSALRCIQQISPSRTTTNGWVIPWSRQWRLRSLPVAPETASLSGRIRTERN